MKGLERPICFTSCAASICKWEKEGKEENREVIPHFLGVCWPSKAAFVDLREQNDPSWPGKSALVTHSRSPHVPVQIYPSARANFTECAWFIAGKGRTWAAHQEIQVTGSKRGLCCRFWFQAQEWFYWVISAKQEDCDDYDTAHLLYQVMSSRKRP